jgi:hypothetical protein
VTGEFHRVARVASGRFPPESGQPTYHVTVTRESLRLDLVETDATVLDVPLGSVRAAPVGRRGAACVEIADAPLWIDFSGRDHGRGLAGAARHPVHALRARQVRRAFLSATKAPS